MSSSLKICCQYLSHFGISHACWTPKVRINGKWNISRELCYGSLMADFLNPSEANSQIWCLLRLCLLPLLIISWTEGFPAWPWLWDNSHALFNMVNIIRNGMRWLKVPERFKDEWGRCSERFSYLKFSLGKLNSHGVLYGGSEWVRNE